MNFGNLITNLRTYSVTPPHPALPCTILRFNLLGTPLVLFNETNINEQVNDLINILGIPIPPHGSGLPNAALPPPPQGTISAMSGGLPPAPPPPRPAAWEVPTQGLSPSQKLITKTWG